MVVHVDPKRDYLSVLSIPRDLLVTVPGHGPQKINTAYVYGGPALVIRTIQRELGIDLDHYLEVDFNAFKAITDKLGGVYVDIDRPYDDGLIQFQPGYQLLDGLNALRYVRTRHDRNYDFGRMERQQRFLSAVREQAMGWDLPLKLPGLVKAVFDNIDTDLSANDVLRLAYWGVKIDGSRIRLAKLSGGSQTIEGRSYVVIPKATIAAAVRALLTAPSRESADTVTTSPGQEPSTPAVLQEVGLQGVSVDVENATGRVGQGALAGVWLLRQGAGLGRVEEAAEPYTQGTVVTHPAARADEARRVAAALGIAKTRQVSSSRVRVILGDDYALIADLIPETATSADPAGAPGIRHAEEWRALATATDFSLVAPTYLPKACTFAFRRDYSIAADDKGMPAVRVGYRYGMRDRYAGLSETTWLDAPVASPGIEVAGPGGVVFTLVGTSTKTDHIWWISNGVLSWVSNTLYFDLQREELLAIALSTLPASAGT